MGKYIFYRVKSYALSTKHAAQVIFNKNILSHSRPLLRSLNALDVYQINLYQHLNFMYKFKNKQAPKISNHITKKPIHQYPNLE